MRAEKRKREPEGQPAERQSPKRKAEAPTCRGQSPKRKAEAPTRRAAISEAGGRRTNPPRAIPKRRMPKSGSREPEGQPAEWQLRSGACRKAEAVNPKANPPRATPKRCVPKSGSREPEGQPTERQPRSGACRKAEAVSPKVNPPSGNLRNGRSPRAEKTAGRSRETRGRRSSADTPTNTIEKRDCDTLRPSEAS